MSRALQTENGDYLSGRGVKRLFDEVCDNTFRHIRRLPAAEGKQLLTEMRACLDREILAEQSAQQEFTAALKQTAHAATREELAQLKAELERQTADYFIRRGSVPAFHSWHTAIIDTLISQALRLAMEELDRQSHTDPPCFAWLAFGQAGRRETTRTSELECLLVHEPGEHAAAYCAELSSRAVAILRLCGFHMNSSAVMPDNPLWRGSLPEWQKRLEELCSRPAPPRPAPRLKIPGLNLDELIPLRKTTLSTPLFELADLRIVCGDTPLGEALLSLVQETTERHPSCIMEAGLSVAALPEPFNFLGHYRVERIGSHRGKLDINRWACRPLVAMIRHQAVTAGVTGTGTLERIQALLRSGMLNVELGKQLYEGALAIFRQKALLDVRHADTEDGAWLLPENLSADEPAFRNALEALATLQKVIYSSLPDRA